jgi:hypothetical protein
LRRCLHQRRKPNPRINRQIHPRLEPKAKAILWLLLVPEGRGSKESWEKKKKKKKKKKVRIIARKLYVGN